MIKVLVLSFLMSTNAFAENKMAKVKDSFQDKVKVVRSVEDGVNIHFALHAAVYKINKKHPKYESLLKLAEKSKSDGSEIKVVIQIPEMEIISAE